MQAAVPTSATFTVPFCIRPDPDEGGSFGPPVDSSLSRRTWYFGCWTNKTERRILSYVEGDIYLVQCADDESYDREVAAMCEFHKPSPEFIVLDEKGRTAYYQDRAKHFIDPTRYPGGGPVDGEDPA